jgi:DNA-binding PadR family transcriptional regulator
MSNYPKLTEMGIRHPEEIEKFAVYTVGNTDILQVTYDRKKGSILPVIRRYKFAQVRESVMVDSGTRKTETLFKSTPAFREALHELEQLRLVRAEGMDLKAQLQEELRLLREDVALRTDYIQSLIDKLK